MSYVWTFTLRLFLGFLFYLVKVKPIGFFVVLLFHYSLLRCKWCGISLFQVFCAEIFLLFLGEKRGPFLSYNQHSKKTASFIKPCMHLIFSFTKIMNLDKKGEMRNENQNQTILIFF